MKFPCYLKRANFERIMRTSYHSYQITIHTLADGWESFDECILHCSKNMVEVHKHSFDILLYKWVWMVIRWTVVLGLCVEDAQFSHGSESFVVSIVSFEFHSNNYFISHYPFFFYILARYSIDQLPYGKTIRSGCEGVTTHTSLRKTTMTL